MNKILYFLFLVFPLFLSAQDNLDFADERIDFEITSSRFTTNGVYYLINHSSKEIRQAIFFPFAGNADSVTVKRVYDLTYNHEVDYRLAGNGIYFQGWAAPGDTVGINISYSQKTVHENIYILSSTQTWGKPLQTAKYSLVFDKSIEIDSFSYRPDKMEGGVYYWDKQNFFPKEEFKIFIK